MSGYKKPTEYFDKALAEILAQKTTKVYPRFNRKSFVDATASKFKNKALKQRVELIADQPHGRNL